MAGHSKLPHVSSALMRKFHCENILCSHLQFVERKRLVFSQGTNNSCCTLSSAGCVRQAKHEMVRKGRQAKSRVVSGGDFEGDGSEIHPQKNLKGKNKTRHSTRNRHQEAGP